MRGWQYFKSLRALFLEFGPARKSRSKCLLAQDGFEEHALKCSYAAGNSIPNFSVLLFFMWVLGVLEPDDGKLSSPVLRGLSGRKAARLPGKVEY